LLLVLVPMLAKQLVRLYELAPQMLDWLQHVALPWVQSRLGLADGFWKFDKIKAAISEHMGQTTDIVGVLLSQATASSLALIGWLANLVLIPVVGFYLLRDWDLMMAKIRSLLPRHREEQVVSLAGECHEVLGAFVRGQLLVMLALGVIYSTGLMLVGLELGLLIGLIAGLAAIVPYMGFVIGIGAALVAGLFQFGDLYPMLGIVAVFMVGQALEGMVLTPLLVGDRIGLHPVAVIFAILAGGELFGFTGVLLALPVAAVIMVLVRHVHDLVQGFGYVALMTLSCKDRVMGTCGAVPAPGIAAGAAKLHKSGRATQTLILLVVCRIVRPRHGYKLCKLYTEATNGPRTVPSA
jgi:predicted PurR-regulated permease PerM